MKNQNKKVSNRNSKVAVLVIVLTLISCFFVGNTFAKYTSTASTNGSVEIAKWAWLINDSDLDAKIALTAGNILDTVDGNADADVAEGKVAPGTKGSYTFTITNNSEVNATYAINYTVAETPIQFYSDAACTTELVDVTATAIDMNGDEAEITIYWKWDFDGDDVADTALGEGAVTDATTEVITIDFTFTQVD